MRNLILTLLILNLTILAGCVSAERSVLKPLAEITGPETEQEACEVLVERVFEARLFTAISRECLFCELEYNDDRTFQFALRFNNRKCGGDSESTLLDRFLICQRSPVILWYDSSEDRYLPWEYAFSYRNAK